MLQEPTPDAPIPFGPYQLIRRIGAGGMGEVFLARDTGPEPKACVVKKVLPHLVENRAFVGRFLDESKVVVRLNHPNIARVYAMGDVAGEYYLTMEYVQGKTVSRFTRRLRDRGVELPLGLVLLIGEQVCAGLQYAHGAKDEGGKPLQLVHRDLSPANVCISYQGDVKIIDFGAAQSTLKEEQTAPRVVIGNLTYMAPEQAKKQPVDGRADVYSCGVMLWELLAWHALPQKGDPIERWRKAANPRWEAPSTHQPSVPRDIDELVLKALRKTPEDRFVSAAEFGEALRKARHRHAPGTSSKELGALLSRVFAKERSAEDAVLAEAVAVVNDPASREVTRRVQIVPPTALAFEHTAVLAPSEDLAASERAPSEPRPWERPGPPVLEPAPASSPLPPPLPSPQHPASATRGDARAPFGVPVGTVGDQPVIEPSLIQEIEAFDSEGPDEEEGTHPFARRPLWQSVAVMGSIFLAAAGLGFIVVYLLLR